MIWKNRTYHDTIHFTANDQWYSRAAQMIVFRDDLPVSHLPGKMPPSGAKEVTSHSCVDEDSVMSDTTAFRMVGLSFGFSFVQSPASFTICTQKTTQCTNFPVGQEVITDKDLCTRHYRFSASTPQLRKKFYLVTTFIIRRGILSYFFRN